MRLSAAGLLVIVTLLLPESANREAGVASGLRSGERVHWLPDEIAFLAASLRAGGASAAGAAELAQIVHSESRRLDVDPLYVLALMKVESDLRANAASGRGAVGLLQLRPIAARAVARAEASEYRSTRLRDPRTNVVLGLRYLEILRHEFADRVSVLAAYNMGPTRLRQHLAHKKRVPRAYAKRVLGAYRALQARRAALTERVPDGTA